MTPLGTPVEPEEDHIQRRILGDVIPSLLQNGFVCLGFQDILGYNDGAIIAKALGKFQVRPIHQHHRRSNNPQNLPQTAHRHGGVHGGIKASGRSNAQKARRGQHTAAGHDGNRRAGLYHPRQVSANGFSQYVQTMKGQNVLFIGKGNLFRHPGNGVFQPI